MANSQNCEGRGEVGVVEGAPGESDALTVGAMSRDKERKLHRHIQINQKYYLVI